MERLLGFDAREMWLATGQLLHPAHKLASFTLREVEKVLSADTLVWPSLFSGQAPVDADGVLPKLVRPAWIGANSPFWENLAALEDATPADAARRGPYALIAATWHNDGQADAEAFRLQSAGTPPVYLHDAPTFPEQRDPTWQFLGFDVADGGFISALCDCGFAEEERPALVDRWARYLNRHHLFDDVDQALAFRAFSDGRVPEHAPFFVVGLWLIRRMGQAGVG